MQGSVGNVRDVTAELGFNVVTGAPAGGRNPIEFRTVRKRRKGEVPLDQEPYEYLEYCRIHTPGPPVSIVDKPVDARVRREYHAEYRFWKDNQEQRFAGIPVEEWPIVQGDEVTDLKSRAFHTVESIAEASAPAIGQLGRWGAELQEKAKAYLAALKDSAVTMHQAEQLAKLREENEYLKLELEELKAAVKEINSKKKKEG